MALAITAVSQLHGRPRSLIMDGRRRARRSRNKKRFMRRAVRERNENAGRWWWQPSRAIHKIKPSRSAARAAAILEELDDFRPVQQVGVVAYEEAAHDYDRERELDEYYGIAIPEGLQQAGRAACLTAHPAFFADQIASLGEDPELGTAAYTIEQFERSVFEHIAA